MFWRVAFCLAALSCAFASAQSPATATAFEVVSIKPGPKGNIMALMQSGQAYMKIDNAQANFGAISLLNLVEMAYRLPEDQISGPDWMDQTRFEVHAKLPEGATKAQVPEMLQTMLAERFKLTFHRDQKVLPVYDLVTGKPPLKFKESAQDDSEPNVCNGGPARGQVCHKVSMQDLANVLTTSSKMAARLPSGAMPWALDRPVNDKTGLTGVYDFTMHIGRAGARGNGGVEPAGGAVDMSAMDAVKALGLNLVPSKHAYDILIIDHVERAPTEN